MMKEAGNKEVRVKKGAHDSQVCQLVSWFKWCKRTT